MTRAERDGYIQRFRSSMALLRSLSPRDLVSWWVERPMAAVGRVRDVLRHEVRALVVGDAHSERPGAPG